MNMTEMGEVYAFLLRHRIAESQPQERRRRSSQTGLISERDACCILKDADEEQMQQFRSFLAGQGLQLAMFDSADYPGIPPGGQIYLMLRNPEAELPTMFSQQPLIQKLSIRKESQETTAVWFIHIWMLMLGLLYTRNNRALSDVSLYQDAVFSQEELLDALKTHLETLRRGGLQDQELPRQIAILLTEKGEDISRRVRNFIDCLMDASLLTEKGKNIFQQTLLGALEVEQSGLNHLRHLIPDDIAQRIILPAESRQPEEEIQTVQESVDVRH
ncbi:hypothetical protein [Endozoicomonas numazuensis]|uniref:Uncharacterized protein n=1 Tax=Endozoicomonas numazuensis TaxID=1137799 RepID=A0A081N3Y4_9GAMM|nr:hypothetical protein [Endozoicomonas numazuensis]KEQ13157.1 hypothetical protein GZ78_26810 [Endozoicomonas numazuensis]